MGLLAISSFIFLVSMRLGFADVFDVTSANRSVFNAYKVGLLQFSAEWCHFSRQLAPIFHEASNNFTVETKNAEVMFGRVDCEANVDLCLNEKIRKYPTVKMLKYGVTSKSEYRGDRSVNAIVSFVREQLADNVSVIDAKNTSYLKALELIVDKRETVVGIFHKLDPSNAHYQYFRKVAHLDRDKCGFHLIHNVPEEQNMLAHRDPLTGKIKEIRRLTKEDFSAFYSWISSKCNSPVRELTFANAEEITDEGLPLLLLFYDDASANLKISFSELVRKHFMQETSRINFVTAHGHQFSHPLAHLGKSVKDLPLFCIDSLVHMYYHPIHPKKIVTDKNILQQFMEDLHSGKLHREYHYGPEVVVKPTKENSKVEAAVDNRKQTTPRESVFRNLAPSRLKYSILHDEF